MSIFDLFAKLEKSKKAAGPPEWIIAGLGNPGNKYSNSRHNAGFMALDLLGERLSIKIDRIRFHSLCGQGAVSDRNVLLIKPQTFMNASGKAVAAASSFYKIPLERVLVLYDDVSLPAGKIRIREKGSAGGHNGIKDIIRLCGTDKFPRVKIGIGTPSNPGYELVDWVLGGFSEDERPKITQAIDRASSAVGRILELGAERAASEFN